MHQLIRILVPATSEDLALDRARNALDTLIGIGMDNTPVFDHYKTFEEPDARFKPTVANAISDGNPEQIDNQSLPVAFPLDSEEGQALLDDARSSQVDEFKETLSEVKAKLNDLSAEDVMDDIDGVRFTLHQLGEFEGPSVYLYDEYGSGLATPGAIDRHVDRLQSIPCASNGGTTTTTTTAEDTAEQSPRGWLVPADVHY